MIGDPLYEILRTEAKKEAEQFLVQKGENPWDRVMAVLSEWKNSEGNRAPVSARRGGLLSEFLKGPVPIDFEVAMPWECTDNTYETAASLAFTLLAKKFPPMVALATSVSEPSIFATLVLNESGAPWEWYDPYIWFLKSRVFQAHRAGAMGALLAEWPKIEAFHQRQEALARGRIEGVKRRQEKAASKDERLMRAIAHLFDSDSKPGWHWTNKQIVDFLAQKGFSGSLGGHVKREAAKYRKAKQQQLASKFPCR